MTYVFCRLHSLVFLGAHVSAVSLPLSPAGTSSYISYVWVIIGFILSCFLYLCWQINLIWFDLKWGNQNTFMSRLFADLVFRLVHYTIPRTTVCNHTYRISTRFQSCKDNLKHGDGIYRRQNESLLPLVLFAIRWGPVFCRQTSILEMFCRTCHRVPRHNGVKIENPSTYTI